MAVEKGLFVAVFTTLRRTHCAVWQKTVPLLNIILHVKMIVHFVMLPRLPFIRAGAAVQWPLVVHINKRLERTLVYSLACKS